ncbi:GlpM protein [Yersinia enterocolitica]|nr:GlpM protein [Yersinia enterocolitica]
MSLLLKALIGAGVVVLIGILAKTRNYYIAGLIPLFPTFALIAHYIVGSERSIQGTARNNRLWIMGDHSILYLFDITLFFH